MLLLSQCNKEINTIFYFLEYSNNDAIKIDSNVSNSYNNNWGNKFWLAPNSDVYSIHPTLFKLNGLVWEKIIDDGQIYTAVDGSTMNNIFVAGHSIKHFNGKNWYEFEELSNRYGTATSICCIKETVFIVFSDSKSSYILKGELYN